MSELFDAIVGCASVSGRRDRASRRRSHGFAVGLTPPPAGVTTLKEPAYDEVTRNAGDGRPPKTGPTATARSSYATRSAISFRDAPPHCGGDRRLRGSGTNGCRNGR